MKTKLFLILLFYLTISAMKEYPPNYDVKQNTIFNGEYDANLLGLYCDTGHISEVAPIYQHQSRNLFLLKKLLGHSTRKWVISNDLEGMNVIVTKSLSNYPKESGTLWKKKKGKYYNYYSY